MVDIAQVNNEQEQQEQEQVPPSQERWLDAQELEGLSSSDVVTRPSVRLQLQALAKKLRKEGDALRRMEQSAEAAEAAETSSSSKEKEAACDAAAETAVPSEAPPLAAAPTPVVLPTTAATTAAAPPGGKYTPIDRFSFDFGGYNAPYVTVYVPLPGVGSLVVDERRRDDDAVSCRFAADSFDLIVRNLRGKSYRLYKDCLEKDIDPTKSKYVVKADKVVIKLAKKKGTGGGTTYDYWSKLTDPKKKNKKSGSSAAAGGDDNPQASIMQLMKDMYEDGDDQMKKIIGETMMKQQRGELGGKDGGGGFGDL